MTDIAQTTRYERVKEILDQAAGSSNADYGGRGRFWRDLPLAELLTVEIHGVRMIASADAAASKPVSSCCCHGESVAGVARPPYPGRGAASGLVRGLRGQSPFDGTRLPRLPWGGVAVAEEEIAFISDWIDDGCPAEDRELADVTVKTTTSAAELVEVPAENVEEAALCAFDVYVGSPNEYAFPYPEVRQRVNLDCMSPEQLAKLRSAFRELYRLNKWPEDRRSYNNMALIHQNHCQHGWERFLPWHRIYLYEFEQVLQDLSPGVTMPYWDWTMARYRPKRPELGDVIPRAVKAFLTKESIELLQHAEPKLPPDAAAKLQEKIVDAKKLYTRLSDFFCDVKTLIGKPYYEGEHRERFIDALLAANALWYPLRYPAQYGGYKDKDPDDPCGKDHGNTVNQDPFHYHYPTADDIEQILSLRTFRDFGGGSFYNDSFGFLDQNPHNTMHIWTGGVNPAYKKEKDPDGAVELDGNRNRGVRVAGRRFHTREDMYSQPQYGDMLSNLTASFDPVFWPIHFNVDRLVGGVAGAPPALAAAGPRRGADAVELHHRRHPRPPALRLRVRQVLVPGAGGAGGAGRPLRVAADRGARAGARRLPPGRGAAPPRAAAAALVLHPRLPQPPRRRRLDADRPRALRRLPGDLRPRPLLRRARPLRPAAGAAARARPAAAPPQHAAQPPHPGHRGGAAPARRRRHHAADHARRHRRRLPRGLRAAAARRRLVELP